MICDAELDDRLFRSRDVPRARVSRQLESPLAMIVAWMRMDEATAFDLTRCSSAAKFDAGVEVFRPREVSFETCNSVWSRHLFAVIATVDEHAKNAR